MIRRLGCIAVGCLLALAVAGAQQPPGPEASTTTAPGARTTTGPATTTTAVPLETIGSSTPPIGAPIGAIVLFDGENTDAWVMRKDGGPCKWQVLEDESMVAGGGDIISKQNFEDFQLHVEFWLPNSPPEVKGQARGNSGVYLQGRYEIQVLDSYGLHAEKHGCGAIYGKKKPRENACTPPQTWQSYDIKFTAPRFDEEGNKIKSARVSVIHNGVTIHDDVEIDGPTRAAMDDEEQPGPAPIMLQDHGSPVRFRNIYVIPAKPEPSEKKAPTTRPAAVRPAL
ncbi:MAG TPA: DUF1080 domain-containing protein [Tepidisphaeraceae bacterium]|nr:DUF1080 domain-containing protein [Tepidisphaeraceae bacterium]